MVFKPRNRKQLLRDAISVLSEHGFHGTSFNDFAKAAGTNTNTLRRHFQSLENLTKVAHDSVVEETPNTDTLLEKVSGQKGVRNKAGALLRLWYAELKRPWARLLFQAHVSGIRRYSESYQKHEKLIEQIAALFPKAMRTSGAARAAATSIVLALLHLKVFGSNSSPEQESELVDSLVESWLQQLPEADK